MIDALVPKDLFVGLGRRTWLYTGAESPPLRRHLKAAEDYFRWRSEGPGGRERNSHAEWRCKENLAMLVGSRPENVALLSNASEALSRIAHSIDWKPGNNVVVHTLEFPSGVLPWLALRQQGVEVRLVAHTDWRVPVETLMNRVDYNTRLVVTSHVSFLSGARIDYRALYTQLCQTDVLLLLDATQSLGAVPVDLNHTDFLVSSSYKWLLAPHGIGVLATNHGRLHELLPGALGWRSVEDAFAPSRFERFTPHSDARRFELGFPSYLTIYALNESLELLLATGVDKIERHVLSLGELLIERLSSLGFEVMTPRGREERAGNVSVVCLEGERLSEVLRSREIYLWGGDGRLRASVHLFNDSQDVEALSAALKEAYV